MMAPICQQMMKRFPKRLTPLVKGEFLESQIEFATRPHHCMAELPSELNDYVYVADHVAQQFDAVLMWASAHPFQRLSCDLISDEPLSDWNLRRLGARVNNLATCSLHVHVAVPRAKAFAVVNGLQRFVPLLIALSSNSPFLNGDIPECALHG